MRFGEVARVVRHLGGSADVSARKIYDLHRRHAQSVLRVIDDGLANCAPQVRSRSLPEGSLLRMVHDPSVTGPKWESPVPEQFSRVAHRKIRPISMNGNEKLRKSKSLAWKPQQFTNVAEANHLLQP